MIDTKAVRALADILVHNDERETRDMLRQCADEIDALKEDAERYQVCRNQSSMEFRIEDRFNSMLTLTPKGVDEACDRARNGTT